MTLTIDKNIEPSTLDNLLDYMRLKKVPFAINDDDAARTAAIKERLRLKYVLTGEWSTMSDEDRQDASLLEGMLYDDENGLVELLNEDDQIDFKNEMKSWAK
jgi:hypothetical protein